MRTPSNDTGVTPANETTIGLEPSAPIRSCILTRDRGERHVLMRLALSPEGLILPDIRAKAPGRGAWLGVGRAALKIAIAKGKLRGALARAFKTNTIEVPADLPDLIAAQLERAALDRLGLEAKAGHLLTGSDKIADAARSGKLHLLAHAADAGADGAGKLAQAWRVGSDRAGSDLQGLVLPMPRTRLSLALGRENVVHIGLIDRAAAGRVREALDRWLHFIGPEPGPVSCDSPSQGASAPGPNGAQAPGNDDASVTTGAQKEDL